MGRTDAGSLGPDARRDLGLREGVDVVASDLTDGGPVPIRPSGPAGRPAFLPVDVVEAGLPSRHAFLRLRPLPDAHEAEEWTLEHRWLRRALSPLPASLRPLTGLESGDPQPSILPPLLYCRETGAWIGAVCPECEALGGEGAARCPQCGTRRPADAGLPAPATPFERVERRLAERGRKPAGAKAAKARPWLPCAACPHLAECFPQGGGPGLGAARLAAVSEFASGALLVEPFDLPLRAWLRLASGERWSGVRTSMAGWPPSQLERLDRRFARSRPTLLGPEAGAAFALETLLLRLDLLRQMLEGFAGLASGPGRPHLGYAPDAVAIGLGDPGAMSPLLWTSRLRHLELSRARGAAPDDAAPPPDRMPPLVPPECRGSGLVAGRCHPRGGAPDFASGRRWDFHFLPQHPTDEPPAKGARVRFSADDGAGRPTGPFVEGQVSFGFRDVWTVTVESPGRFEAALREMLARDDGRPLVVARLLLDHALADDLFAAGTLWLASLLVDPAALDLAAQLRERLREAGVSEPPRYLEAVRGVGFLWYRTGGGPSERHLPEDVLEAALDVGNRLCGGVPGAWPGQGHQPVEPGARAGVLRRLADDVEALARSVRYRLLGFSAEDADVRAALEGLTEAG